jgi:hypothetical protein
MCYLVGKRQARVKVLIADDLLELEYADAARDEAIATMASCLILSYLILSRLILILSTRLA